MLSIRWKRFSKHAKQSEWPWRISTFARLKAFSLSPCFARKLPSMKMTFNVDEIFWNDNSSRDVIEWLCFPSNWTFSLQIRSPIITFVNQRSASRSRLFLDEWKQFIIISSPPPPPSTKKNNFPRTLLFMYISSEAIDCVRSSFISFHPSGAVSLCKSDPLYPSFTRPSPPSPEFRSLPCHCLFILRSLKKGSLAWLGGKLIFYHFNCKTCTSHGFSQKAFFSPIISTMPLLMPYVNRRSQFVCFLMLLRSKQGKVPYNLLLCKS